MKLKRSGADSVLTEAVDAPVAKKSSFHHSDEPDKQRLPESAAYESALLNFKITALLDEVRVTDELAGLIEDRFSRLNLSISKMKSKAPKQLKAQLAGLMNGRTAPKSGSWQFVQPLALSIGGSYACGFSPRKDLVVDVMAVVPKGYFREKDYLNMRYIARKLAYLTSIAEKLITCKWVSAVCYSYHSQNVLRPILLVRPTDCSFSFALHVLPEEGTFAAKRFRATRNNVRPRWLSNEENGQQADDVCDDEALPATPHYNMALLADVVCVKAATKLSGLIAKSSAVRDALLLLKVWLHQRQLDVGKSSISGYMIATFVAELMQARRLNVSSGCYQLFKAILTALSECDWTQPPKVGPGGVDDYDPRDFVMLKDGRQAFDVVLPDVLGCANVCQQLYSSTFSRMKEFAAASVKHMDSVEGDFVDLFLVPAPFARQFDCYVTLGDLEHVWFAAEDQSCGEFRPTHDEIVSHCGDRASAAVPCLMRLVRLATSKRLSSLDISPVVYPEWTLNGAPPLPTALSSLQLGLRFNMECAFSLIDKGPSADDAKAGQFRAFWGDKAEMRRFHDGSICEAVVWPCTTTGARRNVIGRIIKFVLSRHMAVPPASVSITLRDMDGLLCSPLFAHRRRHKKRSTDGSRGRDVDAYGTGEEQLAAVTASFDVLSKHIQSACSSAGLPLSIVSVQGITASFRSTEVFPVPAMKFADDGTCKCTAKYGALEAVCTLEGSGKWPDDFEAVRRLKAVYLLKLGAELSRAHGLATFHHIDHLSVAQDGYLFSLKLVHRLPAAARSLSVGSSQALLAADDDDRAGVTDDAGRSDRKPSLADLALLTGYLSGVQAAHSTYGSSARLAKRWASGHLMSDDLFPEVALELLVSHLFLHPHPYAAPPGSPLTGFSRFLQLLATFDWQHLPLIINFNNELTAAKCEAIRDVFKKERAYLPVLCIATPCDRDRLSLWTLTGPKPFALRRLVLLARRALRLLEEGGSSLAAITEADFRTSTDVCHVVIHLKPITARGEFYQTIQLPASSFSSGDRDKSKSTSTAASSSVAVDVDVVNAYVQELTEAYGNVALFLYDKYDCKLVGVLWKPNAFQPHDVKSTHLDAQLATMDGDSAKTMLSMNAVLEDFELLGRGVVDRVEILQQPTGE